MLRAKARILVTDKRFRPLVKIVARFLIVFTLLWIFSFPYMSRNLYTSENALETHRFNTFLDQDSIAPAYFARTKTQLAEYDTLGFSERLNMYKLLIVTELSQSFEVYS